MCGGNLYASLFCNFSRRVNQKVPAPSITRVQPWRVSMNSEKISRPFAAFPLHETNAHGPPCISTLQQGRNPFSINPSYTTWEKSRVG